MSESDFEDVDEKLQELNLQINALSEKCHYRTMMRVAHEARRLARVEQRLMPYLDSSFHVMNDSRNVLQPVNGRDVSIELITLLESEDRARQFQPNLPEEDYERTKWWLTACSYDNLAVHTASCNGFNSDGMHECITDGIQVCRRTGKLQCISCFREYATDVYVAADDLDMALHHARVGINNKDPGPHDRRHVGAKDSVRILMLSGEVEAAMEMLDLAWTLCDVYHSPYAGKLDSYNRAVELYHLAGCPERLDKLPKRLSAEEGEQYDGTAEGALIEPPRDEFPAHFLDRDLVSAFTACCRGDFEAALQLIQPWDITLREQKCLSKWFEVRLRLIAVHRMMGKLARAQSLAKPLQEAAKPARDWMTLKRLERILDESIVPTPLALAGSVRTGPFAEKTSISMTNSNPDGQGVSTLEAPPQGEESSDEEQAPSTPLGEVIMSFYQRLMQSGGEADQVNSVVNDILAIEPATITDPDDASRLLHVVRFASTNVERAAETWNWAEGVVQQYSQHPTVLSMFAALGARLRELPGTSLEEAIPLQRLEGLFRQSLDLDPNAADNFARAGTYHLEQQNYGEAERCLARGFRLNRKSGHLVLRLAEVYSSTDRQRDALAVLDMALREGCDSPDVAWQAAMTANNLEQFESVLTYIDRFDEMQPDQAWSNHYRACALLELNRPAESLAALDKEAECNPDATYHVMLQRVSCLARLNRNDEFRTQLTALLAIPLSTVTYLTVNGLQRLFSRLWMSITSSFPADDPAILQIENRLLETGMAPNEMFAAHRDRATESSESSESGTVNFYRCVIRQPLDACWHSFPGSLADEQDWVAYEIPWGVLAFDEDTAGGMALEWQQRCYPLPAEIVGIEENGTDFTDSPGIVWQGYREGRLPDVD